MPMDRSRYPENWDAIALAIKQKANWTCRACGKTCLSPEGNAPKCRSERARFTLTVHHANFTPEDNREENLIPLCAPCHLSAHAGRKRNLPPGQLSLFDKEAFSA